MKFDIKKLVKSQATRHRLMRMASFIPDRWMLPLQYLLLLHRWPNLKTPRRFTEWIQFYKINYRNPDMLRCVDKFEVRGYLEEKGLSVYANRLFQVCEKAEDIDFSILPKQFVIKTTSGGNGENIMIIRDKDQCEISGISEKINSWLSKNYSDTSREWAYSGAAGNPRITVEEYLENDNQSLDDYKFLCFNGKFKLLWIDKDRYSNHTRACFDENLKFIPDMRYTFNHPENIPDLPGNIDEMVDLARHLSEDFPFVRVDLYNVRGRIVFGEMTFYPDSGYARFYPDNFDFSLGQNFPPMNDEIWTRYMRAGK